MDIGALSMVLSQASVKQSVGISLYKTALNVNEETATQNIQNVLKDPNLGANIDLKA